MIENLRQGYWVAETPFGYTNENRKKSFLYLVFYNVHSSIFSY
jgi:hypothetical protein